MCFTNKLCSSRLKQQVMASLDAHCDEIQKRGRLSTNRTSESLISKVRGSLLYSCKLRSRINGPFFEDAVYHTKRRDLSEYTCCLV